jgi:hypothetical protein
MITRFACPTLLLFVLAWASPLQAQQRPLVTEDPETVGTGRVLIEGGVEFNQDQDYSAIGVSGDTAHIATYGVSVGISPAAEIQIDSGLLQRLTVTDFLLEPPLAGAPDLNIGDSTSSMEDLFVATKIRVLSENESRPALGVRFGTKLPTASHEEGLGLGTTDFFASLLIGKTVRSVRTVGNVGLQVLGNPRGAQEQVQSMTFGVSVARALTNAFEMVTELNGRLKPFGDAVPQGLESRGVFRLAGRYTYKLLRLDFGILVGLTEHDPSFGISAGATYVISR